MNLLEKAKAAKVAKIEQEKKDAKERQTKALQATVDAMVKSTVKGLKQFHNVDTTYGTLKLITGEKAKTAYGFVSYNHTERIAILKLDRSNELDNYPNKGEVLC